MRSSTNSHACTRVLVVTRTGTVATVRARENNTGSSNRLRKLSAARLSVSLAAYSAEVATACGWMRSRFICAMRMVYMRTQTTMVRTTIAKAGRKMARGMGVPGWMDWLLCHSQGSSEYLSSSPRKREWRSKASCSEHSWHAGLLLPRQHQLLDLADRLGRGGGVHVWMDWLLCHSQ